MTLEQEGLIALMLKVIRGLWDQYQEPMPMTTLSRAFSSRLKRYSLNFNAWLESADAFDEVAILYLRSGKRLLAPKREWLALGLEEKKMLLTRLESRLKGEGGRGPAKGEGPIHLQRIEFSKTAFQSPDMEEFE